MKKMTCIIVDDEALAREGLEQYVKELEFLELTGCYRNALAAQHSFMQQTPDLMFLDINMPKISGLSFLESLAAPPVTIITTAYPDFALEGFRLDVLDYLLKPVPMHRFLKAVNKAYDYFMLQQQARTGKAVTEVDYIFVKQNHVYEKVMLADIVCVEAMQNYVVIHTVNRKLIIHLTFKTMEESLPGQGFIRVHKSFLINLKHIRSIEGNTVHLLNKSIPVGRGQREELMRLVVNGALVTREKKEGEG